MNSSSTDSTAGSPTERKKASAKRLIGLFFLQLTEGCGRDCNNDWCASSGRIPKLSKDEAAVEALRLFLCQAKLCSEFRQEKTGMDSSIDGKEMPADLPLFEAGSLHCLEQMSDQQLEESCPPSQEASKINSGESMFPLNEKLLYELIESCKSTNCYRSLSSCIFKVFSDYDSLKSSFHSSQDSIPSSQSGPEVDSSLNSSLTKEDIRAMEVDLDKDEDSREREEENQGRTTDPKSCPAKETKRVLKADQVSLDLEAVRRSLSTLFSLPSRAFQNAMINGIIMISQRLEILFRYDPRLNEDPDLPNVFLIVMEIPILEHPEYLEAALPAYCKAVALLPVSAQAKLVHVWSRFSPKKLKEKVDTLHQLITLRAITGHFTRDFSMNEEEVVVAATKTMKLLYCANMLGGSMDGEEVLEEETIGLGSLLPDFLNGAMGGGDLKEVKHVKEDLLYTELGLSPLRCCTTLIPHEEFYNEPLSDQIEMDKDFSCFKSDVVRFSFMSHAFILTPPIKALGLYYDNRITMYSERRLSVLQSVVHGEPANPYLRLKVRRDHLIDDTLVGLEVVAMENPNNLKKQLVVEFESEQGIDEGGISKEFFQLIVEELFNPDYAMFTLNPETQTYWFNPTSFENDAQFTLVGIILGLAIYNNVILDVHFPLVVYKKLLGKKGTFRDLSDCNPGLARGLQQLLDYSSDDIEEVFMQTFRITYLDVFGSVLTHNLKEGGDEISVNHQNKKEMVELYSDFLLNESIKRQFCAFRRGFQMVTEDSPLKVLFRPEEIELLICGSQNFDFMALEEATDYDGGYTVDTTIIRSFWELAHEFTLEQKRKLLQFTTGSDRAPVGGLAKLKMVIARSGPDTDRLPTAHTCFNVLLLPEYANKEKLKERLLKAINYSKGFGML